MEDLNYIYIPDTSIADGFRCRVPLKGSRQLFVVNGGVQGSHHPLSISFDKGQICKEILQVINVRTSEHKEPISYKNSFRFGAGSSAKLILCSHTFSEDLFKTDEAVELTLEEGAKADIVVMQNEHNNAEHHTCFNINIEKNAELKMTVLTLHGGIISNEYRISLNGIGASADLSGLYLVDGRQKVTNNLTVNHKVPECYSRELFKGILDNNAVAEFTGLIHVFPDAQHTEAYQECHSLLLSREARAYTQPQLEIYADDVKCSHGATNGRLNEDELFYMRSRGIPLKEASVLQQSAFAWSVLENISSEELRERMSSLVDKRLRGEFSNCCGCSKNCC